MTDPLLILDDAAARAQGKAMGLPFTGTLGVLLKSKQSGLIAVVHAFLDQLEKLGFFLGSTY
jgi:predicted nucleic acid-binding protein